MRLLSVWPLLLTLTCPADDPPAFFADGSWEASTGAGAGRRATVPCPPGLGEAAPRAAPGPHLPLDGALRLNHLQVKGTHNSYHVRPALFHPAWNYTHLPLDRQLEAQGVRQVELDVSWDPRCERYQVFHIGLLDEETTCRKLTDCLSALRGWSDAHPGHVPLFVQIEPKDTYDAATATDRLAALDAEILSVWPRELLITPDDVRGAHASLREAILTDGWPTLADARGKALVFMDDAGAWRDHYTRGRRSLAGRVLFAQGQPGDPIESVLVLNDPLGEAGRIRAAVAAGFLVRTRADADGVEPAAGDCTRLRAALALGAHMVSTDFPAPVEGFDYAVELPGGTPSRCNPATAPPECTPEAVALAL